MYTVCSICRYKSYKPLQLTLVLSYNLDFCSQIIFKVLVLPEFVNLILIQCCSVLLLLDSNNNNSATFSGCVSASLNPVSAGMVQH